MFFCTSNLTAVSRDQLRRCTNQAIKPAVCKASRNLQAKVVRCCIMGGEGLPTLSGLNFPCVPGFVSFLFFKKKKRKRQILSRVE
jgi:hypothetical protein